MEQWRRRLSIAQDSAAADASDSAATEAPAEEEKPGEDVAGGSYEFVAEGECKQAGTHQHCAALYYSTVCFVMCHLGTLSCQVTFHSMPLLISVTAYTAAMVL